MAITLKEIFENLFKSCIIIHILYKIEHQIKREGRREEKRVKRIREQNMHRNGEN